jgi:hypothetical protein
MIAVLCTIIAFGLFTFLDSILAILLAFFYLLKLPFDPMVRDSYWQDETNDRDPEETIIKR